MSKSKERKWDKWIAIGGLFKEGGQGRLYLVKDSTKNSDETFVLKELKNPKRLKRFERELKAINKIKPHPNVIRLIDSGIYRSEDNPCYVMEKADCSLDEYLPALENNINTGLKLFELICEGIAYLHEAGIIHRDIKPENILMFHSNPKISDFGLCLIIDETRFTPTDEAVGSRLYMAPEMEDGKVLDIEPTVDIYSLGKILYFILSKGKIFSREQFDQPEYKLSKKFVDPRFDIFSKIFKRSISLRIQERCKNIDEFRLEFNQAVKKFETHPRTTGFSKLGSYQTSINEDYELSTLELFNAEEIEELIKYYRERKLKPPIGFLDKAIDKIPGKDIDNLIFLMIENEAQIGIKNLIELSGKVFLIKNPKEIHFTFIRHDYVEHFLALALENDNIKIIDSIAQLNIFNLHSQTIILKLSKFYFKLTPAGRQNFLLASYNIQYEGKIDLMIKILDETTLDDILFEAVIASISSINNPIALNRIIAMEDIIDEDRIGPFLRGMMLGINNNTKDYLSNHNWRNPLIKITFNALKKSDDNE
jgi:serine/threonine protein kinase